MKYDGARPSFTPTRSAPAARPLAGGSPKSVRHELADHSMFGTTQRQQRDQDRPKPKKPQVAFSNRSCQHEANVPASSTGSRYFVVRKGVA
jgi:hypothetical protein